MDYRERAEKGRFWPGTATRHFKHTMPVTRPNVAHNNIQDLENITSARWLLFIIGALTQAMKVLSMKGVPGTQAWAIMFVSSFCVFEILPIVASTGLTSSVPPVVWIPFLSSTLSITALLLHSTVILFAALQVHTVIYNDLLAFLYDHRGQGVAHVFYGWSLGTLPGYEAILVSFFTTVRFKSDIRYLIPVLMIVIQP